MEIINGKVYRIKSDSEYLKNKYGVRSLFRVEGTDREVFGGGWLEQSGNPACALFGMRAGIEGLSLGGTVYYGKIGMLGELIHESELEEVTS